MDEGKVKPPGGAKIASCDQQQGDDAELDDEWRVVMEEELRPLANVKVEIVQFWDTASHCFNVYLGSHKFIRESVDWMAPTRNIYNT